MTPLKNRSRPVVRSLRKRELKGAFAGALIVAGALASPLRAEPSVYPTGTTIYDPAKTYNSFVLFSGGDSVSRLIDLNGKVVHEWKFGGQPVAYLDPALAGGAKGHVFVTLETEEGNYLARAGAVLIKVNDEIIGVIGVGGARGSDKDEQYALAGLQKVQARLK
jgi:hypothetical protein